MTRVAMFFLLAACSALALAQESREVVGRTRAVVPAASMYGGYGYGGYQQGSTAAGSALNGMASVISSKGDYNLSTSEAAINLTQAQSQEIQVRQQYTDAYFAMKETNKAARAKLSGPRLSMEQLTKIAREGAPEALDTSQVDPVSGRLTWPVFLQDDMFKQEREVVDRYFSIRANNGGLNYSDRSAVNSAISGMFRQLKAHIRDLDSADYLACRNFLNNVMYAATKNEL